MAQIGVQAMMLKDDFAEVGVFEALRNVRQIGYRCAEISQLPMTTENVAELRRARDELDMTIASISAMPSDDAAKVAGDAQTLGTSMVRIPMLPLKTMLSEDLLAEFCDQANEFARRLADDGVRLYYHNHHIEFEKRDGKYVLDIIADRCPLVGLEIDAHWVQRGGLDPERVLRKYGERVAMVHLKDYRVGSLRQSTVDKADPDNYDYWGIQADFATIIEYAEVGEGNLDWTRIIPTAEEIGARYLLVEQDMRYGRSALDCLRTSYDNLVDLGFGHLF